MLGTISKAQTVGLGASGIYNLQTSSVGFGVRIPIYGQGRLNYVPQVAYYPGFNQVHEFYLGFGLEYNVGLTRNIRAYALGNAAINGWINYANSPLQNAGFANWGLEAGAGIAGKGCIQPFAEWRYNVRWQEANLRVGISYIFGCGGGFTCPSYM